MTAQAETPTMSSKADTADDMTSVTHLLYFAGSNDVEGLQQLLDERHCDVNAADYDGRTAMHLAACEGHLNVVKLLLKCGANVNPQDRWGSTPLMDARHYNHLDVCKFLEEHGARLAANGRKPSSVPGSPAGRLSGGSEPDPEFEIEVSELDFSEKIPVGKGSIGEIWLVRWRGTRVAVKMLQDTFSSDPRIIAEFRQELALLQKLRHPNIVQFLGAVTRTQPLMLVTEYLSKGNLHEIIEVKGALDAARAIKFAVDIARGMNYLHQHRPPIIHRDLKPRNLLRDDAGHLKVGDFGLGKLLDVKSEVTGIYNASDTLGSGSYRYTAPEVFREQPYTTAVDVYAFAIICHEMFEGGYTGRHTSLEDHVASLKRENYRPPFKVRTYPAGVRELIKDCWDEDPKRRPTFARILDQLEGLLQSYPQNSRSNSLTQDEDKCHCCIL